MSLIQSAKMNNHDLYAYLKDVLERLPTQRYSAIYELLPHNWMLTDKMVSPDGYLFRKRKL